MKRTHPDENEDNDPLDRSEEYRLVRRVYPGITPRYRGSAVSERAFREAPSWIGGLPEEIWSEHILTKLDYVDLFAMAALRLTCCRLFELTPYYEYWQREVLRLETSKIEPDFITHHQ